MSVLDLKEKKKVLSKRFANVDIKRCVACGECAYSCPKAAITIYNGCYAIVDSLLCVGCGKCSLNCPAGCINILEREGQN